MQNELFRRLTEAEKPLAAELWQYCFADGRDFTDWYFKRRAEYVFACVRDGYPAAQLVCVPLSVSLRGAPTGAVMLSGVAVSPGYRGQGYMNGLMREGLRFLRERGAAVAALYPFDYGFYRRYGFACCGEIARLKTELSRLTDGRANGKPRGEFIPMRGGAEDAALLAQAYRASFEEYSGHVLRDEASMAARLEELALDEGYAVLYRREGRPEGYILYHFCEKRLCVDEIGACGREAREDMLAFLANHASTAQSVELVCPLGDPLRRMLPDARGAVSAEPYDMLRIIDLERALTGIPAGNGELFLRVSDTYAPWNEGVWRFRGSGGVLAAERANAYEAADISIGALTQWVFGYAEGLELGRAQAALTPAGLRAMEALLPKQPVFIYEMY